MECYVDIDNYFYVYYNSYRYPYLTIPFGGYFMRTVQMTLDDDLVKAIDKVIKKLHTSRSAFTRSALKEALKKYKMERLETKHQKGYELYPVIKNEFSVWENEQVWGDE